MYDARTASIYDLLYDSGPSGPLRDASLEADRVRREIRAANPAARSLLDVGCATGRHLRHLTDDFTLHGLDANPFFLEVARRSCPEAAFHQADMEAFELGVRFDAIVCLFSTIAYVATPQRMRRTLERFARHLSSGGVVIIEPWFSPTTFWDGHVAANHATNGAVSVAWMHRQERIERMSTLEVHYLVGTRERVDRYSEHHEYGLFTHEEHMEAMAGVGLEVTYDPEAFGRGLYVGVAST